MNMKLDVAKMCIRADLNMIYTTSRLIATVLPMADTMPLARETLRSVSSALLSQAAEVHGRILRDYGDDIPDPAMEQEDELDNLRLINTGVTDESTSSAG